MRRSLFVTVFWVFLGLFFVLSTSVSGQAAEGITIQKDVYLNSPILSVEDLPPELTVSLYDAAGATVPIATQTFARGEYALDFELSKSNGLELGPIARLKVEFTNKLYMGDDPENPTRVKEIWSEVAVNGQPVGVRTRVSDETMVKLLLASDASLATYVTFAYEGDTNPLTTIYQGLPLASGLSAKEYISSIFSTVSPEERSFGSLTSPYWEFLNNNIYYPNGNVGVGTGNSAPNRDFQVKYSSSSGNLWELPTISVTNTNTTAGQHSFSSFEFSGSNGGVVGEFFADGGGYFLGGTPSVVFRSSTNHPMLFGTNKITRMMIDTEGEVGIGTTDPLDDLHIESSFPGIRLTESDETSTYWRFLATGRDLQFREETVTRMVIEDGGDVGIGTTGPTGRLHVSHNSSSSNPQLLLQESENDYARINLKNSATTNIFALAGRPNATDSLALLNVYYSGSGGNIMTFMGDGDVGIGTTNPTARFHVSQALSDGPVVRFQNTNTSINADVLELRVDGTLTSAGNDFVQFKRGNTLIGRIESLNPPYNGVAYVTSGSDFAEYLPKLNKDETIEPGDIVGVTGGKVTKHTKNADYVQVVSTAPGWVGNCPSEEEQNLYEQVAFMGQVPVKVRGKVELGDYIVSSGLDDGTGVAVAPDQVRAEHHGRIIGRAWEASSVEAEKMVNTAISHNSLPHELFREKDKQIDQLTARVEALERVLGEMMQKGSLSAKPQT